MKKKIKGKNTLDYLIYLLKMELLGDKDGKRTSEDDCFTGVPTVFAQNRWIHSCSSHSYAIA